jgi:Chaperone of endosialidase
MATNGITPPINERPNYFAGQYLLEDDFKLEQQYHIDRQRWHYHLLHVSGIAEGLKVTKGEGDLAVNVSEGSAIDPQGRQIILLALQTVELTKIISSNNPPIPDGTYTLYIGYSEQKTDQQTAGNEITSRRWQEEPKFQLSSSELKDFIPLTKLTITNGVVSDKIDNSDRVYSGLRLPTIDGEITLSSQSDGTKSLAELKGSLSIAGMLSVTDNVGIGMPPNSGAKLQVKIDGATTAASLKLEHNGSNLIVRPASAGGNSSVIENTGGGSLSINPNGGNVGIGTTSPPTEKLEVSGNIKATGNLSITGNANINSGNANNLALLLNSSGAGWGSGIQFKNTATNAKIYGIYSGGDGKWHFADVDKSVDRLVVDKDGNVGIGTTTPSGFQIVLPESSKSSSLPSAGVTIAGGASGNASIELRNSGTGTPYIDFTQNAATLDYDARIRLTEPGKLAIEGANVGIGTTTPAANLQVRDTIGSRNNYDFSKTALLVNSQTNNGGNSPANAESVLALAREGVPNQSYGNMVDFRLSNYKNVGPVDGTQLDLYLTEGQFSPKQVMSLRANGNVGIGTPDPTGKLTVVGSEGNSRSVIIDNKEIKFRGDGLAHFSIFANRWRDHILTIENTSSGGFPGVTDGTVLMALNSDGRLEVRGQVINSVNFSSSDVRWKKNIETIASALDKVLQLRGVTFEWRKEEYQEMNFNPGKHLGLIAQEVERVIPEVVHQNEEGYKSVAYSNLVALSIEALKELQAKHENLLPTIQAQQAEIDALKAELNRQKVLLITQPV